MRHLGKTAILLFSNSSKKELDNKPFPKGEHLFNTLTKTTLEKAKNTGLPVFLVSENEQIGLCFGKRFANAVNSIFEEGFSNVITIGNDTPHLKTSHLITAYKKLEKGEAVLGPSADGGFYLLGINKNKFDFENFEKLPWQKDSLFGKIYQTLTKKQCVIFKLPVLQDLDSTKDIQLLLNTKAFLNLHIIRLIQAFNFKINSKIGTLTIFIDHFLQSLQFNKGSPQAVNS